MNTNTNNGNAKGKVFARVVFFMSQDPDTDRWEPMAYFPDIRCEEGNGRNRKSYMHGYGFGPCAESYLFEDCRVPSNKFDRAAVKRLKEEIEGLEDNYVLTVVDTAEWVASKAERAAEVKDVIFQLCYKKDSELMLAANAARKRA